MPANALQQHSLRPLLLPRAVAIVGASQRPGALGRVVLENALRGSFADNVHAVNPRYREVLARRCFPTVTAIGVPVDLAIIATPADLVSHAIEDSGEAGVRAAIVLSDPPSGKGEAVASWVAEIATCAAAHRIRLLGPGAFGLVRTDVGVNASISDVPVQAGRVALIAQSGALCTAMLDFAAPFRIGFSTVVSLGGGVDVDFGELLDFLLLDPQTDSILLYVESLRNARRFLSALRAAARTKPVIVLRSGRSCEARADAHVPLFDDVFDAAMRRAGTVRVRTYTQLFAAARILALGRIPRDDRIAIIANGRAPALLAADAVLESDVRLAELSPATEHALEPLVPYGCERANPIDVRADAQPERIAAVLKVVLADANVDAAVVLHAPRPAIAPADMASAVAGIARNASKPVLAAWLGAIDRPGVREALESGGVANFYTPENAIDAFAFLAAYRRHQQWLLEVPAPQEEPRAPDLTAARAVLRHVRADGPAPLNAAQSTRLLAAFHVPVIPSSTVRTGDEAKRAAHRLGFPVTLEASAASPPTLRAENVRDARAVVRAYDALTGAIAASPSPASFRVRVRKAGGDAAAGELRIAVHTDATFGPVISLRPGARFPVAGNALALMLPPLNRRLAHEHLDSLHRRGTLVAIEGAVRDAVIDLLLSVSALVCALPWVVELELDPMTLSTQGLLIGDARIVVDRRRAQLRGYAHMAIHPYPIELVDELRVRDGARVLIRPIRPEDAETERAFVNSLSEETRYFRFFYRMHELTPAMLARFTQIDYDRELALVAVVDDAHAPSHEAFAGVARYVTNPDGISAEYAIVVHDAWQKRGIGRALMERLLAAAKRKGLARLEGAVLRENVRMVAFVTSLGFTLKHDLGDGEQVMTMLNLTPATTTLETKRPARRGV